ncbi:MAG TPA: hypothetical protein RMG48_04025 [Myxococcales bacterium LLY-WYZ-16_1]|jgi:hypothetical protein|nr:hypothetical protein [Myxococcales bacterium LLY-WYZ-16_1]
MTADAELIIRFEDDTDESAARVVAAALGCSVRRRMRTDDPEQVQLLVKVEEGSLEECKQAFEGRDEVVHVEVNAGGFEAL